MNRPTTAPVPGASADSIELFLCRAEANGPPIWLARHTGPHAAEIRGLFQTDTIPTAYTALTTAADVHRSVQDRNPTVTVRVLPEAPAIL